MRFLFPWFLCPEAIRGGALLRFPIWFRKELAYCSSSIGPWSTVPLASFLLRCWTNDFEILGEWLQMYVRFYAASSRWTKTNSGRCHLCHQTHIHTYLFLFLSWSRKMLTANQKINGFDSRATCRHVPPEGSRCTRRHYRSWWVVVCLRRG